MKSNIAKLAGGILLVALIVLTPTLGLVSAKEDSKVKNGGGRLEGTWDVLVTIRDCQTDAGLGTFASIGTFMSGGTMLDSTSGMPQALKTPGHGVWSHVGANIYRFKFKSLSFDPIGNFSGWTIINHEANLNSSADAYESAGTAEFYDANGVLVRTGCSSTTATRFE